MDSRKIVMLGLPGTGKTTYLAALWYLGNTPSSQCSVHVERLGGDVEYLNAISLIWAECTPQTRTPISTRETTVLMVRDEVAKSSLELHIPDASGELVARLLSQRSWDAWTAEAIKDADGILLFVNPADVTEPSWIFNLPEEIDGGGSDPVQAEWTEAASPTQVQLVDLLQLLLTATRRSIACSLIVSAWDLVRADHPEPGQWLSERLPLLDQFLSARADRVRSKLFGVSAQGGRLPSKEKSLLKLAPDLRPSIVEGAARGGAESRDDLAIGPHDLGAPIRWLESGNGG